MSQGRKPVKHSETEEELKSKRLDKASELRMQKRQRNIHQRRKISLEGTDAHLDYEEPGSSPSSSSSSGALRPNQRPLSDLYQDLFSEDVIRVASACTKFRTRLSERDPPIEEVLQMNVVPRFLQLLTYESIPQLQFEAAWIFTNLTTGTPQQTRAILDMGVAQVLLEVIQKSSNLEVCEQCIWTIGNIAGDGTELRDFLISLGCMDILMNHFINKERDVTVSTAKQLIWAISNLLRGRPPLPSEQIHKALPFVARMLHRDDEEEIVTDACWAISYMDGDAELILDIANSGVVRRLVTLLGSPTATLRGAALRALGLIVSSEEVPTQIAVNCNIIPFLMALLSDEKQTLVQEACWVLSNITAGRPVQIQRVIDIGVVPVLMKLIPKSNWKIKCEAAYALANIVNVGNDAQTMYMVDCGFPSAINHVLLTPDPNLKHVCLSAIYRMLDCVYSKVPRRLREMTRLMDESSLLEKIEDLQYDPDSDLAAIASRIYDRFFSRSHASSLKDDDYDDEDVEDDDEDDDDDGPSNNEGGGGGDGDVWAMGDQNLSQFNDRVASVDSLPSIPRSHAIEDQFGSSQEHFNF